MAHMFVGKFKTIVEFLEQFSEELPAAGGNVDERKRVFLKIQKT